MSDKVDWKKEYFKLHKLMGMELTPLIISNVFVNEKGNRVYLQINKQTEKNTFYILGYVSFKTKTFLSWLVDCDECISWEEYKREIKELEKELK